MVKKYPALHPVAKVALVQEVIPVPQGEHYPFEMKNPEAQALVEATKVAEEQLAALFEHGTQTP